MQTLIIKWCIIDSKDFSQGLNCNWIKMTALKCTWHLLIHCWFILSKQTKAPYLSTSKVWRENRGIPALNSSPSIIYFGYLSGSALTNTPLNTMKLHGTSDFGFSLHSDHLNAPWHSLRNTLNFYIIQTEYLSIIYVFIHCN